MFIEKFIASADGLNLYYRDYNAGGAGSPILCLHGLTRNSKDFEDLAPHLVDWGYRVLVPDVRGRGRSDYDPNPANYHVGTYAQDVLALLAQEDIPQVILIGTSMGGLIAMTLALFTPDVLAGVVLNDVGPEVDPAGIAHIASYVGKTVSFTTWDEAIAATQFIGKFAYPNLDHAGWEAMCARIFKQDETGKIVGDYDPAIAEPFKAIDPNDPVPDAWAGFEALIGKPVLAIRGVLSNILSVETFDQMKARHSDMHICEVAEVGHAPLLTEPDCLTALKAFLAD